MIRSTFFAAGMFVLLCGAAFLITDRVILNVSPERISEFEVVSMFTTINPDNQPELALPDWAPFGLMTLGAVTLIYSFGVPRKKQA